LWLAPGADPEAVKRAIEARLPEAPTFETSARGDPRGLAADLHRTFA